MEYRFFIKNSLQVFCQRKPCQCPNKMLRSCCPDGYPKGSTKCECPKYPATFCCPTQQGRNLCKCPIIFSPCCPNGYQTPNTVCECPNFPGSFCCPPLPNKKKLAIS